MAPLTRPGLTTLFLVALAGCSGSTLSDAGVHDMVPADAPRAVEAGDGPADAMLTPWHTRGYPRAVSFRRITGDPDVLQAIAYNTVVMPTLDDEKLQAARNHGQRHPDALVLVQLNNESKGIFGSWNLYPPQVACDQGLSGQPEVMRFLPDVSFNGFWLPGSGSLLTPTSPPIGDGLDDFEISVEVEDPSRFKADTDVLVWAYHDAALQQVDWARSEFFHLIAVQGNTLTLQRMWPEYATAPSNSACKQYRRAFLPGQTYVATHSGRLSGKKRYWLPNLTSSCPRDSEGRQMTDFLSDHWAALIRTGGYLDFADGLQFDVSRYTTVGLFWTDCDADRQRDGCMLGDTNLWGRGIYDFFLKLRRKVGSDVVLVADANGSESQRFPGLLNGGEWENFPETGSWDRVSSMLDHYLWWSEQTSQHHPGRDVNCLSVRFPTELYNSCGGKLHPLQSNSYARLGVGIASLGSGHIVHVASRNYHGDPYKTCPLSRDDYPVDELCMGRDCHDPALAAPNWLGLPQQQPERLLPPEPAVVLPPSTFETGVGAWSFTTDGGGAADQFAIYPSGRARPGSSLHLRVSALSSTRLPEHVRIVSPALWPKDAGGTVKLVAGADYVVSFVAWARALDHAEPGFHFGDIPRSVGLRLHGASVAPGEAVEQTVLVGRLPRSITITLRAPQGVDATPYDGRLEFLLGEEPGEIWLDDISAVRGCGDVFLRRFEAGLVLVNACPKRIASYDMSRLFPDRTLRRLKGSYDPAYNNGQAYLNETLTLPPMNALFLQLVPRFAGEGS